MRSYGTRLSGIVAIVLLELLAACSGGDSTSPSGGVEDSSKANSIELVAVLPTGGVYYIRDTVTVRAIVRDYRGNVVNGGSVKWTTPGQETVVTGDRTIRIWLFSELVEVSASFMVETGRALTAKKTILAPRPRDRMFVWTEAAGLEVISLPAGIASMSALDVNDAGEVTGSAVTTSGYSVAFTWSRKSSINVLESFIAPAATYARAINSAGTVIGWTAGYGFVWNRESGMGGVNASSDYTAPLSINAHGVVTGIAGRDAFVWRASAASQPLSVPQGVQCSAGTGINDKNEIVGFLAAGDAGDCIPSSLVLWEESGAMTEFFRCNQFPCDVAAAAINNHSEVAGHRNGTAFRWTRAKGFVDLKEFHARANDVNDAGDVVGALLTPNERPYLWKAEGQLIEIPLRGDMLLGEAAAVNNTGMVVGWVR